MRSPIPPASRARFRWSSFPTLVFTGTLSLRPNDSYASVAGWRPILAHPEQIHWLVDDLTLVERLVGLGAMLQVTGASVLGRYDRATRDRVRALLDAGLAHFLASDGHDLDARPPGLSAARAEVARRWGEEAAELLTETNPRAVLDDRPLGAAGETLTEVAADRDPA